MRKIGLGMRVTVLIVAMLLLTVGSVRADSYYQTATSPRLGVTITQGAIPMDLTVDFGSKATQVSTSSYSNQLTGFIEYVSGAYETSSISGNIYNLVPAEVGVLSTVELKSSTGDLYLTMIAQAMTYNSSTGDIGWDVKSVNVTALGMTLETLIDMNNAQSFSYTMGTTGGKYYNAKLEGFAAAPEPAEWMLMFIGLGMLGFYLKRRGYLNFDLSPQSVA